MNKGKWVCHSGEIFHALPRGRDTREWMKIVRHSGGSRNPVPPGAGFNLLKISWTPVFTGVTTKR